MSLLSDCRRPPCSGLDQLSGKPPFQIRLWDVSTTRQEVQLTGFRLSWSFGEHGCASHLLTSWCHNQPSASRLPCPLLSALLTDFADSLSNLNSARVTFFSKTCPVQTSQGSLWDVRRCYFCLVQSIVVVVWWWQRWNKKWQSVCVWGAPGALAWEA